jgi:4-oxalocrotonate tautomerase family enzyme
MSSLPSRCVPVTGPMVRVPNEQSEQDRHMPLIQIDLMEGYGDDVHRELIQRCTALFAEIVVAPIERFRATLNVVPAAHWGLGGDAAPSKVSPLIQIHLMDGRPLELLHRLMHEMSTLVAEILNIPVGDTRAYLTEFPATHWGIGGIPASQARAAEVAARAAAAAHTKSTSG